MTPPAPRKAPTSLRYGPRKAAATSSRRRDAAAEGRQSYDRRAWGDAYAQLCAADQQVGLPAEDLERLSTVAQLLGRDAEAAEYSARAYHDHLRAGSVERAARCAFWLAFWLTIKGEIARGSGWGARADRLLRGRPDCAEHGLLLLAAAYQSMDGGDNADAYRIFARAADVGRRFDDPDLTALAGLGLGQTLVAQVRTAEGVAALDEVMLAVTDSEVSPLVVGLVYCGAIDVYRHVFDLRRAQEWTESLSDWCADQPDLVPYRGQCLIHRAEIMQLHGSWAEATTEAGRARDRLTHPASQPAVGAAWNQLGELHRLRGEWAAAEDAYDLAAQAGHSPQPGLALLRLAQGRVTAALAAIRRIVAEADDAVGRARVLPAAVEISLAANEIDEAGEAAAELVRLGAQLNAPVLHADALSATAAVTLARGDPRSALPMLRSSLTTWQELDAPYEIARIRTLLGLACRQLGDSDGAKTELATARRTFQLLGAAPDLNRLEALSSGPAARIVGGLTAREVQVLTLVAAGKTNREIAADLVISEHTVRRHLQNIFRKLGVTTRSAATAYALLHNMV